MRPWSLVCVVLSGCFVARGSGVEAEEAREVGSFDEVHNSVSVEVTVVEGEGAGVVVRCDDNLLDLLRTEVSGGELRITTPTGTSLRPRGECAVDVTAPTLHRLSGSGSGPTTATGAFPDLAEIDGSGSGEVVADGLEVDALSIRSSGSGGVVVSGDGQSADLEGTGSGGIDAHELTVDEADVRSTGSGEVSLTVLGHASVRLSGSGDVRLSGDPHVDADDSGSGNVVVD